MPYNKPYRKKKRYYRKKKRYARKSHFNKKLLGDSLATTLVYNAQYTLDAGASPAIDVHILRANGMFDPDQTGFGHQPRGFDQLMALYDHYVVVGSRITIKVPAGGTAIMVGIALRDSIVKESTLIGYQESRNFVSRMISSDSGGTTNMSYGFSARKFLGRSHPLSDSQLKGSATLDPVEQADFHVFTGAASSGQDPPLMVFDCTIEYRAVFIEPRNPGQS